MEYTAEQDDWAESNAVQLIRRNIEYIEARLDRAVRKGWPLPSAAIVDLGCSVGRRLALSTDPSAERDRVVSLHEADGRERRRIPWNIIVAPRLMLFDKLADALDGTRADLTRFDQIIEMWANATEDEYPVIAICREEWERPEHVGLASTVLNLKGVQR